MIECIVTFLCTAGGEEAYTAVGINASFRFIQWRGVSESVYQQFQHIVLVEQSIVLFVARHLED